MPARTLAVLALFAVAGCSEAPWVQSASADRVILRWYPDTVAPGVAAAQVKADAHCARTGRRAALVSTGISGSVQLATYECR